MNSHSIENQPRPTKGDLSEILTEAQLSFAKVVGHALAQRCRLECRNRSPDTKRFNEQNADLRAKNP